MPTTVGTPSGRDDADRLADGDVELARELVAENDAGQLDRGAAVVAPDGVTGREVLDAGRRAGAG